MRVEALLTDLRIGDIIHTDIYMKVENLVDSPRTTKSTTAKKYVVYYLHSNARWISRGKSAGWEACQAS